jgi:hypothetical protein
MKLSPLDFELGDAFRFEEPNLIVSQYRPLWKGEQDVFPDEIPVLVIKGECELVNPRAARRWFANPMTKDQLEQAYEAATKEAKAFVKRQKNVPDTYYVLVLIPAVYPSGAYRLFPYLLRTTKDQLPTLLPSVAEYLTNIELGIYINLVRAL